MFDDLLNVEMVTRKRRAKGLKIAQLIELVGMKPTAGYIMFRTGLLPQDRDLRNLVLEKLTQLLGVDQRQLIIPPHKPRVTA